MLEPVRHILGEIRLVLASSSPRRSEVLRNLGLNFDIIPSTYEEDLNPSDFPNHGDFVVKTAINKVNEVAQRLGNDTNKPTFIIGFDTVVSFKGIVYGKPKNKIEATTFLNDLSGNQHTVYTGVVIKTPFNDTSFYSTTEVTMAKLDQDVIKAYVESKEPLDKAGAYGIQGLGGSLIQKIDGDYYTVMGVPLHETCLHLANICKDFKERFTKISHHVS